MLLKVDPLIWASVALANILFVGPEPDAGIWDACSEINVDSASCLVFNGVESADVTGFRPLEAGLFGLRWFSDRACSNIPRTSRMDLEVF